MKRKVKICAAAMLSAVLFAVSAPVNSVSAASGIAVEYRTAQEIADYRLPLFLSYPIKRRFIACGPILERIDLRKYLHGVDHVTVGGETSREARICDYEWVLDIRQQCLEAGKTFWFKETGSRFKKDGVISKVNPYKQHSIAKDCGIDIIGEKKLF